VRVLSDDGSRLAEFSVSPAGIATGLTLWNLEGTRPRRIGVRRRSTAWRVPMFSAATFNAAGTILATGGGDGVLQLWNPRVRLIPLGKEFVAHTGQITALAFNTTGTLLASSGVDGAVRIWNAKSPLHLVKEIGPFSNQVDDVVFNPKKRQLAVASGSSVTLWDVDTGREIGEQIDAYSSGVRELIFSPDGSRLVAVYDTGDVRTWKIPDRRRWGVRVCKVVAKRNLSADEWTRFFGSQEPYRKTCQK
jgi:WD40 repeat protein